MKTANVKVTLKLAHMIVAGIGMLVLKNLGKSEAPDFVVDIIEQVKGAYGVFDTLDVERQDEMAEFTLSWPQVSVILNALGHVAVYGNSVEAMPYEAVDVDVAGFYFSKVAHTHFQAEYDAAVEEMQAQIAAEEAGAA